MESEATVVTLEVDRTGRASCKDKDCKSKIEKGSIRVTKKFSMASMGDIMMSHHFHPRCFLVNMMPRARSWKFSSGSELAGYDELSEEQKAEVDGYFTEAAAALAEKASGKSKKAASGKKRKSKAASDEDTDDADGAEEAPAKAPAAKRARKTATAADKEKEDDEDEEEEKPKKAKKTKAAKPAVAAAGDGEEAVAAKPARKSKAKAAPEPTVDGGAGASLPDGWDATGQLVLFTGFRDAKLEEAITKNGGEIAKNFNKSVTLVVAKDPSTATGKVKDAQAAGILVCDGASLYDHFGVKATE